ncbi:copper homeostasis protein CutC [Tissierella carlieri]|uniref:copper homeostasis protein CutC n=1 Tax=Tissierella carlieri TaxID=689904 RepID=UPI001C0F863F|nr:copper homeostasis protein CutC [Tissierella carlieri]MBU5311145.1 copper homeostasis protein CutC [Tissierella carlieri]
MKKKINIEICVDSIQSALAAQNGGASRIELCDNLIGGGTTPSAGMIELARKYLTIDINVMIRPRSGDFCYSPLEIEVMKRDIEIVKKYGVNGIVIGVLRPNGEIDINIMKELIELSRPLTVTFHRAFDMTKDPFKSLDILIDLGVERILTSGKESKAMQGIDLIRELVTRAEDKIIIMPGSGVNEENVRLIIDNTGTEEIHLSAKKRIESIMEYRNDRVDMGGSLIVSEYDNYFTCEESVRNITKILNNIK